MSIGGVRDRPQPLRIELLGAFRIHIGARPVPDTAWRLRKAQNLVKLLALAPDHRLHREQALETLWPDHDPAAAANNLHRALHAIRRTLEPALAPAAPSTYLRLRGDTLALAPHPAPWIDTAAFQTAGEIARRWGDPALYEEALALYTGDLLPEDPYEDWAAGRREQLRGLYVELLGEVAGLYDAAGAYAEAIGALERVVAREPGHEEAHAGLMRLYALLGQRYQALRQYQALRAALRRELDVAPGRESERLYCDILAGRFPDGRRDTPTPALDRGETGAPRVTAGAAGIVQDRPERALGLEQGTPRVVEAAEAVDSAARAGMSAAPISSPALFIGRERELGTVTALLTDARLLTLTGAGGCGKTRLALEAAARVRDAYPDGVRVVELASLADPALVPQAVAVALGVREEPGRPLPDTLIDALRPTQMLVTLDNCEHLAAACARLAATLLAGCPGLRILVTSRQPVGVAGETVWRVPSLAVPDPERLPPFDELAGYDAVRLFVERARAARPDFALTPGNALEVVRVCLRLDGIPLAIELAAVWIRVLAVESLLARLDDVFDLLVTGEAAALPRHHALRATMDWSYGLLDERERLLWRRLAVFAGGWTLEAAEDICAGRNEGLDEGAGLARRAVLHALARLVDASVVVVEARDDGVRYRLLETVRQYGAEKAREAGEDVALRRRHAAWYLALAERAEPELAGPEQGSWLDRLEREHDNLRAALDQAVRAGEWETGVRLAGSLATFWLTRGYIGEGRRRLTEALSGGARGATPSATVTAATRAKALMGVGMLTIEQGDYAEAAALLDEAMTLRQGMGDERGLAESLKALGNVAHYQGNEARAVSLWERSLALRRALGDATGVAEVLHNIGVVAYYEGDYARAIRLLEESLGIRRGLRDQGGIAYCLINLGNVAFLQGGYRRAVSYYRESLALRWDLGAKMGIVACLQGLVTATALGGQPERAAWLLGVEEAPRARYTCTGDGSRPVR